MTVPPLSGHGVVWNIAPDDTLPPPILCGDPVLTPWLLGSLPPAQYERLHATLKCVSADPNGRTLLRAYAIWAEVHGTTPDIVWRESSGPAIRQGISIGAQGGVGWLVDLDYLADAALPQMLKTLGDLYVDLTQVRRRDPFASLAPDHVLRAVDPALEQAWNQWLVSVPEGARRDARARAIVQMRASLFEMRCHGGLDLEQFRHLLTVLSAARSRTLPIPASLDLSNLGLDSVPPIPPSIDALNLSGNSISDWGNMPASLRMLELRRQRGTWPEMLMLPPGLTDLDLSQSDLRQASSGFLDNLQALGRLKTLLLADTDIASLPQLGNSIRSLDISGNRFSAIPANLPTGVVFLYAARNPLESLPARREDLPASLRGLYVRSISTQFLEVPEALLRDRDLSIDMGPRRERATGQTEILLRAQLRSLLMRPDGASDVQRCKDAAARWDGICRDLFTVSHQAGHNPGLHQAGGPGHSHAGEATAFYSFLQRLEQVPAYRKHEDFRRNVRDWLVDLASRKGLRETTLGACLEANETCSDRLLLAYNRLMMHRLGSDIEEGLLDEDIPRVIDIARQAYTLEVLTDIAEQIVSEFRRNSVERFIQAAGRSRASSHLGDDAIDGFDYVAEGGRLDADFVGAPEALGQFSELELRINRDSQQDFVLDEVEIHLAILCLVCAPDALDLWAIAPERMALESSQIDGPSVKVMAMAEVRRRGEQEFLSFLALDYSPWTGLLKRKAAQAYDEADARRHAALETDYEAGLDAAMQALALEAGEGAVRDDARKDAGPAVARRLQLEALLPVTLAVLEGAAAGTPIRLPFGAGRSKDASAAPPPSTASAAGWQRV
ncbi:NEL-type E3 ubiquitin ligase domain-containing protein [Achromobacter aloeverae]|uniref:NEL domain-containing protein n=1 Tax=Achromobacter aloeverae TaxID=1750518 RepID=A0A4Q1HLX5_9BURK|nr:NEL-type E3 ubiquitin ligase domain-containing protein [Achromobacter aloeverae]RXN90932.1 hypothetical protein C7R54_06905 [Achromobacter aloeverae]